jgi:hypothetical protein
MTTQKQLAANRQNALSSTGPKTPGGKAVSRFNALRHGLRAESVLIPDEDPQAHRAFCQTLVEELQPAGEMEAVLVERIVTTAWRLRRVGRVEAGLFVHNHYDALAERAKRAASSHERTSLDLLGESLNETAITNKEAHARALREVDAAEALRDANANATAAAFARDQADTFGKLTRYEAALERSLYKALHELQRLQLVRAGRAALAPIAVDVTADTDCPAG